MIKWNLSHGYKDFSISTNQPMVSACLRKEAWATYSFLKAALASAASSGTHTFIITRKANTTGPRNTKMSPSRTHLVLAGRTPKRPQGSPVQAPLMQSTFCPSDSEMPFCTASFWSLQEGLMVLSLCGDHLWGSCPLPAASHAAPWPWCLETLVP